MCIFKHNFVESSTGNLYCKDCGKTKQKPSCTHDFEQWAVVTSKSNSAGQFITVQTRACVKCNLAEFKKDNF
jgi:hypothetical protein